MLRFTVRKQSGAAASTLVLRRLLPGVAVLGVALAAASVTALSTGPVAIPFVEVASALLDWVGIGTSSASNTQQAVIENIRLPRVLLAIGAGAGLGVAGVTMQALFRNPLADPGIIGVSSGGALGAVIAIALGLAATSTLFLPLFAFVGAVTAIMVVFGVGVATGGRLSMASLLLAGVAVSSLFGAITSAVIILTANLEAQRQMIFWLAGGLEGARWESVRIVLAIVFTGVALLAAFGRELNLLLVGEDEARSLGVRVGFIRILLLAIASLLTGTAVAFTGTIGFVGLVVPHSIRMVIGPDNRALLPLSALGGGLFLLVADTLARNVASPIEIRVGIITALTGAPFFLFLLIRQRSRADML